MDKRKSKGERKGRRRRVGGDLGVNDSAGRNEVKRREAMEGGRGGKPTPTGLNVETMRLAPGVRWILDGALGEVSSKQAGVHGRRSCAKGES